MKQTGKGQTWSVSNIDEKNCFKNGIS